MTWTIPTPCGWYNSGICPSTDPALLVTEIFPATDGPETRTHSINTDYSLVVSGTTIPIVKTIREWFVEYSAVYAFPPAPRGVSVSGVLYNCNPPFDEATAPKTYATSVKDDCIVEKSTIYYIDQRYGVCLYKYQKDELHLSAFGTEYALLKTESGAVSANQIQIKTNNYTATSTTEWRLLIDGVERVLTHEVEQLAPFGPRNNGLAYTDGTAAGWVPDPETRLILLFPQPPSEAIPLTNEIVRLGFYDYGNLPGEESELNRLDGGYKDMYYPQWCRFLQEDPLWRAAADRRYDISWNHAELSSSSTYTPPAIDFDFMPKGSFVRHPVVGDVYQFLLDNETLISSPDLLALIDSRLPEDSKTHDTTLIYPISLV